VVKAEYRQCVKYGWLVRLQDRVLILRSDMDWLKAPCNVGMMFRGKSAKMIIYGNSVRSTIRNPGTDHR
jgi:hypothetical protein